ncbi:hypothetical protein D3C79_564410 [compost metagenome]
MRRQLIALITFGIGQQIHLQRAGLVEIQRDLQIPYRPRGQLVSNAFDTAEIELEIEHFKVENGAVQRLGIANPSQITLDLFRLVTLMTTNGFQLTADTAGDLAQRGLGIEVHFDRQYVDHRAIGAQRSRTGAAHKDETGAETAVAAQARHPQRHQRQRHIRHAELLRAGVHQLGKILTIAQLR